jgi:hypothetical protein
MDAFEEVALARDSHIPNHGVDTCHASHTPCTHLDREIRELPKSHFHFFNPAFSSLVVPDQRISVGFVSFVLLRKTQRISRTPKRKKQTLVTDGGHPGLEEEGSIPATLVLGKETSKELNLDCAQHSEVVVGEIDASMVP